MSKKEDLISRLKSKPKDFTIFELDTLMHYCNCEKSNQGKTSGSKISYKNIKTGVKVFIDKPHPGKILKPYIINRVISFLESVEELERK